MSTPIKAAPIHTGGVPTTSVPTAPVQEPPTRSLGDLVSSATADLSALMRKEVELAKLEIKREAVSAGKGAGAFGAAAFAGVLGLIFLSIALAYALGKLVPLGAGFLIVGVLYLLVAGLAALFGRRSLKKVGPPEKTIETVKGDIAWAKHPTVAPTRKVDTTV